MSPFRILLYIFLAIFAYKFITGFLIPVIRMSWRVRRQIKEFQRQQQPQEPVQQNSTTGRTSTSNNSASPTPKSGEYIDFEEVKE